MPPSLTHLVLRPLDDFRSSAAEVHSLLHAQLPAQLALRHLAFRSMEKCLGRHSTMTALCAAAAALLNLQSLHLVPFLT